MKRSLNRWLAALLTACMLMTAPVALMEEALEGYVEEVVVELGEDIVIADGEALPADTDTLEEAKPAQTEPSDEIGEAAPAEEAKAEKENLPELMTTAAPLCVPSPEYEVTGEIPVGFLAKEDIPETEER